MVVQIGTPAELIVNPADDYVAEFTSDVPLVRVLTADDVMQSDLAVNDNMPQLPGTTTVESLLPELASHDGGIAVVDNGSIVGVVTPASVITALARESQNREANELHSADAAAFQ